jgi:hypothetical protein
MYQNAAISIQNTGFQFQPVHMQKIDSIFLKGSNNWISKHQILNYVECGLFLKIHQLGQWNLPCVQFCAYTVTRHNSQPNSTGWLTVGAEHNCAVLQSIQTYQERKQSS